MTFFFPRYAADPRYGPDVMRPVDYSCYAGASAFLSTPSDLVRFGIALKNGKLLQPATVKLLQTSQRLPSGEETGYGLGWDLETVSLSEGGVERVFQGVEARLSFDVVLEPGHPWSLELSLVSGRVRVPADAARA